MVLILLLYGIRVPSLLIDNDVVFTHSIFHKGPISDYILWLYEIQFTYMKVIDKVKNILVLLNHPNAKSGISGNLNNVIDTAKVLKFVKPGTIKALSISKYFSIAILKNISLVMFWFYTI